MRLLVLPEVTGTAAENMATDLLLLERASAPGVLWFRHYGWSEPAFTFGVSQSREAVRAVAGPGPVLVRRPTGGGVVSHLNDWTYALVAPSGHRLSEARATESYHAVHAALARALAQAGVPAVLVPCPRETCGVGSGGTAPVAPGPGVCFVRPEIYDVVRADDGRKLAGAAQKRTREGILFQGSVDRAACGAIDWDAFRAAFLAELERVGEGVAEPAAFPGFPERAACEALARFGSDAWNARR